MSGLIKFRWIAIVFLIFGIVPLWRWGYLPKQNFPYFMGVLALLGVFNALSQGVATPVDSERQRRILVHLSVDLLAAVGLLFVSGSANNPFVSILCIHAFLGGMLLRGRATYFFGATVLLLLSLLQLETFLDERITVGTNRSQLFLGFLAQWVLISASWFVSHYFSGLLHKNEESIRLLQSRQHQADRLKALGALTAGFSHQLATPLNSLKLRMQRGMRKISSEDPAAREEFEKAQTALEDCVRVFQHMASVFSRSSQSDLKEVDLGSLTGELVQAWQNEEVSCAIETHFTSEPLPCRIQVLAFSQTFFDVLDNALEASPQGSLIVVRLYRKEQWIILEVRDQGPGLSSEILSRLGEPFMTSKPDGNGLGLYSAMLMAQAAGGEFRIANSVPGGGAIAQLHLPLGEL